MYCWKCGQELTDGASTCVYCGANQRRPEPASEAGRAMRRLYDRYGRDTLLTNNLMLVNGLGDLVENSQKLRNQMKMALDAGVGRLYLDQLNATGAPDTAFDQRVKRLMTDDAGLSDKAAAEIAGLFDDMIGWRTVNEAKPASAAQPQLTDESREEIDRATGEVYTKPKLPPNTVPVSSIECQNEDRQATLRSKLVLPEQPVPTMESKRHSDTEIIVLGVFVLLLGGLNYVLGKTTGIKLAFGGVVNAEWVCIPFGLIMIIAGIEAKLKKHQKCLFLTRTGGDVRCSWSGLQSSNNICLAVNDTWIDTCVTSPYELRNVPEGSRITLASMGENGVVFYIDSDYV